MPFTLPGHRQRSFSPRKILSLLLVMVFLAAAISRASASSDDPVESVRFYTRQIEFDYTSWILDALSLKLSSSTLELQDYLPPSQDHAIVVEYMQLMQQEAELTSQVTRIYADAQIPDPQSQAAAINEELDAVTRRIDAITPTAEGILQKQITAVLADLGLTVGGQPVPPVWFHNSPLPMDLIISPRDTIREDAAVSVLPDMTVAQMETLENDIYHTLDKSALVVPVGGIGVYPTMVMQTSDLTWLCDTITHEWIHNYLTLRPLGINYETTPELRTMNETTASLAGKEIGAEVIRRYYPELVPTEAAAASSSSSAGQSEAPSFSYNAAMHKIRVTVDALLKEGKIDEAEKYMDDSRQIFLENGYVVRKINQAYFAFYGAYADEPGGAAGADPVGPAVVKLREQSRSLTDFLHKIAWMTSFAELQAATQ